MEEKSNGWTQKDFRNLKTYLSLIITGTLNVYRTPNDGDINAGELIFTVSGQRTNSTSWLQINVDIFNISSFKIAVEAITGLTDFSDIAIDGVSISPDTGEC